MTKRSILDSEIGLIKAMLSRGMKNRDIQFYFNRQDRPVNSGRITQIKNESYGSEITEASEAELDAFLASFAPSDVGVVISRTGILQTPTLANRARDMFEDRGRAGWFLKTHESEIAECKERFCLRPDNRFADAIRSIAGLANNEGGFVFFGVRELPDGSLQAAGMASAEFEATDPAEINRALAGALDPVPIFSICTLDLGGNSIGVVRVEKHEHPPVIAIKNIGNEVKEGAIYYRYVGETRVIKPGELRKIIARCERKAVEEFVQNMGKVADGTRATLDLDTGTVAGKSGNFVIDAELLPKIQFVREGEFREAAGAPTLRLVGDVVATGSAPTNTVRRNVTDQAVLLNFLKQEPVAEPLQYVLHLAHTGRRWLPVFDFARRTGSSLAEVADALKSEDATHPSRRDAAVSRLNGGGENAFQRATGRAKMVLDELLRGTFNVPTTASAAALVARAVQGLPASASIDFAKLRQLLLAAYLLTHDRVASRNEAGTSYIFRAACRVDELEFGPAASTDVARLLVGAALESAEPIIVGGGSSPTST